MRVSRVKSREMSFEKRKRSQNVQEEEALNAMDYAKMLTLKKDYKGARRSIKTALKLFPQAKNGVEMLIISEILHYGKIRFPFCGIDWYCVLHLHPSATDSEVKTQSQMLLTCIHLMEFERFPGATEALHVLKQAKYVLCDDPSRRVEFDCKRKKSGFVDMPRKASCSGFKQDYLNWEPPKFQKKPIPKAVLSSPPKSVAEVVDGVPKQEVLDEMHQSDQYLKLPNLGSDQVNSQNTSIPTLVSCTPDLCVSVEMLDEIPKRQVSDEIPQSVQDVKRPRLISNQDNSQKTSISNPVASISDLSVAAELLDEMPHSRQDVEPSLKVLVDQSRSQKKRPMTSELVICTPECDSDVKAFISVEAKKPKLKLLGEMKKRPERGELMLHTPECASDVKPAHQVKKPNHLVFDEMPQSPHYAPLDKFKSKIREGIINGLDMSFISLCEEIQMLEDPQRFSEGLDDFTDQLKQFEEMGYDVKKLRERLDTLKGIAERDQVLLGQVDKFRVEAQVHEASITYLRRQLLKIEAEIEKRKVMMEKNADKIDLLEKASMEAVEEFVSTAKATWK